MVEGLHFLSTHGEENFYWNWAVSAELQQDVHWQIWGIWGGIDCIAIIQEDSVRFSDWVKWLVASPYLGENVGWGAVSLWRKTVHNTKHYMTLHLTGFGFQSVASTTQLPVVPLGLNLDLLPQLMLDKQVPSTSKIEMPGAGWSIFKELPFTIFLSRRGTPTKSTASMRQYASGTPFHASRLDHWGTKQGTQEWR